MRCPKRIIRNWNPSRHRVSIAYYSRLEEDFTIDYTRSREYHKNDNAHVESKNWSLIRQYLGYERFDNPQVVFWLNDLYKNEWRELINGFLPSMKLVDKHRKGSKIIKTYDSPKTPLQRVLESPYVLTYQKHRLKKQFKDLNPFELVRVIQQKSTAFNASLTCAGQRLIHKFTQSTKEKK